ncbi:MAG: SAM-dependent methyltransferase, partial [Myxococcaceae bacterium]|nr:SAM-dependent methyltransferase [Myxococcaceae bacterium]
MRLMEQIEMSAFAEWLAAGRKKKKLSQAELAKKLGVSQAQVSQWESGKQAPKPEQLPLLEKVLGKAPTSPKPAEPVKPSKRGRAKANPENGQDAKNSAIVGFEKTLWEAADKLRGSMDSSEYKHVVLGLIFLKYVSDTFEQKRAEVEREGGDVDDRDEYEAAGVFWVPPTARWPHLRGKAKQPDIGVLIDRAMEAIEKENPSLKGTLPKEYARPQLDKERLGGVIDLMSKIDLIDPQHGTRDLLGRVYEYFL